MAAPQVASSVEFVSNAYKKIDENIKIVRRRLNRPLTYAEKVLLGHLTDPQNAMIKKRDKSDFKRSVFEKI